MKLPLTMALLSVAAAFTQPAFAYQAAQANISALGVQLIDLDINDDVSPEISFFRGRQSYTIGRASGLRSEQQPGDMTNFHAVHDLAFSETRQNANGYSQLNFAGGTGAVQASVYNREGWNFIRYDMAQDIRLGPKTGVIFSGHVSGFAHNTEATKKQLYASSYIWMNFWDGQSDSASALAMPYATDVKQSYQGRYQFVFGNYGDDYLNGYMSVNIEAIAENPSPIPEPESWAMMGAGLLLLGAIRRKRQA